MKTVSVVGSDLLSETLNLKTPKEEFNFIANMIDAYVTEQDKGSEGANQDG